MKKSFLFEKANPMHPDKVADRIAGAVVDLAYKKAKEEDKQPIMAVEVLLGHGKCYILGEGNITLNLSDIQETVKRITKREDLDVLGILRPQDEKLNNNQKDVPRCGDNGIFKAMPSNLLEILLPNLMQDIYSKFPYDGKSFAKLTLDTEGANYFEITICQSKAEREEIKEIFKKWWKATSVLLRVPEKNVRLCINPLGDWVGGLDVDSGATNRKLGSDLGRSITGGGIHGKDLTKADITLNLLARSLAIKKGHRVDLACSIGDEEIFDMENNHICSFKEAMIEASEYIKNIGGFEKLAEWGFLRPIC